MATIKDIAKKAGVSMMTVSRAFNEPGKVKQEVREMILLVAKELDYVPNHAAKSLASKKTGVIQIVSKMHPDDYYFTQLFTGAAHYLSDHGYSIMINRNQSTGFQYDGVIYMGLSKGEDVRLIQDIKKPFVLFGKSDLPLDWVDVDNIDGSYMMTKHVIEQGHKNIGFLKIDQDEPFTIERYTGYEKAMDEAGLNINKDKVYTIEHSVEGVRSIGNQLIKDKAVTAYICESDVLAFGLINFAQENGLTIPEDLSIAGFDGFLFNNMSNPHITTVRQPVYAIGVELAKTLVDRIKNPEMPIKTSLIKTLFEPGGSIKTIKNE